MRIKTYGGANETLVEMDGEHVDEVLFSYSTPVAAFVPGIGYVRTTEHYSSTTTRHITRYLDENGGTDRSAAQEVTQSVLDGMR